MQARQLSSAPVSPWRKLFEERANAYWMILPVAIISTSLTILPILSLLIISLDVKGLVTNSAGNYVKILALGPATNEVFGIPLPFQSPIYIGLIIRSIVVSALVTIIVLMLAYPMAYFLTFHVQRNKHLWLFIVTAPFWISYLLRIFSWKIILGTNGLFNSALIHLGLIERPFEYLLYSPFAVVIALVHSWVAFAVLPIFVSLSKIDPSLLEAASNLGDNSFSRFIRITLPLSLPGTLSAAVLVFIPTVGDYFTPLLVGGTNGVMVGNLIQAMFTKANDPGLAAALSTVMMAVVALIVTIAFLSVKRMTYSGRQ